MWYVNFYGLDYNLYKTVLVGTPTKPKNWYSKCGTSCTAAAGPVHPSQPCIDPTDAGQNPFCVAFIAGNISVCHGCKQRYKKDLGPPNDICILHEEWRTYMVNGTEQSRFGNAYYHVNVRCVNLVWPSFLPSMLVVLPEVERRLLDVHKSLLREKCNIFI